MYAKQLTKDYLVKAGITAVSEDGKVFNENGEIKPNVNNSDYFVITLYDLDADGNKIKLPITRKIKGYNKLVDTYIYKTRTLGLHRIVWAWYHGETPFGMVVDHINSNKKDNRIDNLQLLTPQENTTKEKVCNIKEIPCKLDRPRSYYEEKLAKYEALYEEAKKNHDADAAHKQRTNIANIKGKIRYWDANRKEVEALLDKKAEFANKEAERIAIKKQSIKERKILNQYKLMFKENKNKDMWRLMVKTIKEWDNLDDIQKDHVWEVLSK